VVVQALVSLLVVGLLLPGALAALPSVRASGAGPWLALAGAVAVFLILRLVWPRSKRQ
jgi:hypothetical protein